MSSNLSFGYTFDLIPLGDEIPLYVIQLLLLPEYDPTHPDDPVSKPAKRPGHFGRSGGIRQELSGGLIKSIKVF
jgi:hypothetical protein